MSTITAPGAGLREEAAAVRMLAAELSGEDLELAISSETMFVEAAEAVLGAIRDAEMLRDAAKARAQSVAERAELFDHRAARLRDVLVGAMAAAGVKSLPLPEATVTVSDQAPSATLVNEEELPAELFTVKTTRKPDMREIARRLRQGQSVPGAVLRNMPPKLVVRVR